MSLLRRYASPLIFAATMVIGGALLLDAGMQARTLRSLSLLITQLSDELLRLLGFAVERSSNVLASPDRSFAMRVDNDCNGTWAHLIFLASVLAYPATWRERLLGLTLGQAVLFVLNVMRIASLFVIGVYAPSIFRATHVYVWQFLIIGLAFVLFFIWVDRVVRQPT